MKEEWRDIQGYEGYYQVSDMQRVKSLDRIEINVNGIQRRIKGRILKQATRARFYKCVKLCKPDSQITYDVHRLVAVAFIENPENKPEVNHIDHDPSNNAVGNLEWTTHRENMLHCVRAGRISRLPGIKNPSAKLNDDKVRAIHQALSLGIKQTALAEHFQVSRRLINKISTGELWKHLYREWNPEEMAA